MKQESPRSGTWLCPTEFDRMRLLDMERRLQWARAVMFGALGVGFAASVPWIGWWPVVLVVVQVVVYASLRPLIAASARPEYPIAFVVVLAQVLIAAAVALTGASQSPLLNVFLLGIVGLPARFGTTRVVAAGLVLTELLIFGATAGVDLSGFAGQPAGVITTAAASFGLVAFAHALMQAESQKRSESVVDSLTGLPNRRSLEPRFEDLRADARRTAAPLALLLCDLDLFKSINDRHGHQRGDAVLFDAARRSAGRCGPPSRSTGSAARSSSSCSPAAISPGRCPWRSGSVPRSGRPGPAGYRSPCRSAWGWRRARAATSTSCSGRPTPRFTRPSAPGATGSGGRPRWLPHERCGVRLIRSATAARGRGARGPSSRRSG